MDIMSKYGRLDATFKKISNGNLNNILIGLGVRERLRQDTIYIGTSETV